MPNIKVMDMTGNEVSNIELSDAIFGITPNVPAMHTMVVNYLANQRQGTVHSYPYRGKRRRQKALETEGYRSRKTGFHPCSSVDTRRYCSRT